MKQLSQSQIREQVVIGMFQFIGWVLLGAIILTSVFFVVTACLNEWTGETYNKGYNAGAETQWSKTVNIVNDRGQVRMINIDGTLNITLEKKHYCNDLYFAPFSSSLAMQGANFKVIGGNYK